MHCLVWKSRARTGATHRPAPAQISRLIGGIAVAGSLGAAVLTVLPATAWSQNTELAGSSSRVTDMREMAMFHNSNVYVWIRATDAGTVLVYASVDYRNAFAQPVVMSADEADQWAAVAEPLTADSLRIMATRRDRPDTTPVRGQLADGDILLLSRPRTDPPSLTVKIGALGPGTVTTTFLAPAIGTLVPALREAARAAREMSANRAADSTARAASLAAATAPVQPPTPLAVAQPTPAAPEPVAAIAPSPAPVVADATAGDAAVVVPAAVPAVSATLAGPVAAPMPNVAQRMLPSPAAVRVRAYAVTGGHPALPASRTTTIPVRSVPQSSTVAIVATTTPVIPPAPPAAPTPFTAAASPPAVPAAVPQAPAPAVARVLPDSAALADGGLSDDEFATEAHRRESSMTACYAQYGLSANPALRGKVTVRISLSDSGEVMRATVVDRSWSAAVPTEVESCIVHRVFVWHFPVARRSSIHDYTLTFGH